VERLAKAKYKFGGYVGERIAKNQENWLLQAPLSNPAMLYMFADRDRKPRRELQPWSGEFAGKYLISAVQGYRLTRDKRLFKFIKDFTAKLVSLQDADGYLGAHPKAERLTGMIFDGKNPLWDLWSHYHIILGLVMWWQETKDRKVLNAACKAADVMCDKFLGTGVRAISAGSDEMNLSSIHGFCILYKITGNERYLRMAREIEKDWETPPAGDYVRTALEGKEFFQTPKPRWESIHGIQAIAELYLITGDEKYRKAVTHIWQSIRRFDRHNTGAFSSAEQAVGNPYDERAIETCCVVAWAALSIDILRITGDPAVADEIELSLFNALLGAQHPSGRWCTYNTPMDGVRKASAHEIVFQAYQGAPELNCCSVNGPRGLGMLSEWAFMEKDGGIAINYFGPCRIEAVAGKNTKIKIEQETDYPVSGKVKIRVSASGKTGVPIFLRVPAWSKNTKITANGKPIKNIVPGSYVLIENVCNGVNVVNVLFDLSLHFWEGEKEKAGKISVYRGPLLLAYDQRFNSMDPDNVPAIDPEKLDYKIARFKDLTFKNWAKPWVLLKFKAADGRELALCDFASAGAFGTHYRSWLPFHGEIPPERKSCFKPD